MKPIKLTAIILASVITVLTAAVVISLISYSSRQQSQKPFAPAKVENIPSKPIQSEPVTKKPEAVKVKPKPRQLSKTAQKADKAAKPVVPKTAPAPVAAVRPAEPTIPAESTAQH
jgi:hypothetical protein